MSSPVDDKEEDSMCSILNLLNFKVVERQPGDQGYWEDMGIYQSNNDCRCGAQLHKNEAFTWRVKAENAEARMVAAGYKVKEHEMEIVTLKKLINQQTFSETLRKKLLVKNQGIITRFKNKNFLLREENRRLSRNGEKDTLQLKSLKADLKTKVKDLMERIRVLEKEKEHIINQSVFQPQTCDNRIQVQGPDEKYYVGESNREILELKDKLGQCEKQILDLTGKLALQEQAFDTEHRNLVRQNQRSEKNKETIYKLKDENSKMVKCLDEYRNKIGELEKSNKKVQNELLKKGEYLQGVERILGQQQQVLKNLKEKHKKEKENLLDARMNLELDVASKDVEIDKLKTDLEKQTKERTDAELKVDMVNSFVKCCNSDLESRISMFGKQFNLRNSDATMTGYNNHNNVNGETRLRTNVNRLCVLIQEAFKELRSNKIISDHVSVVNRGSAKKVEINTNTTSS